METIMYPAEKKANRDHKCNYCGLGINKGTVYLRSIHVCDGEIYTWKSHKECAELASKLKMYDDCDEGLTEDDFIESIKNQYSKIMSETQNDIYESKDFVYPRFRDRLILVLNHYVVAHDFC